MHKNLQAIIYFGLICIACLQPARAQVTSMETSSNNPALKKAVDRYDNATIKNGGLYIGTQYQYYPETIKGDAYYPSFNWQKGTVMYNHAMYNNVGLLYDVNKDIVVIKLYNSDIMLGLVSDKVEGFSLASRSYKRVITDSANNNIKTGFYEILYGGKTEVLLRRQKNIQKSSPTEWFFDEKVDYYIKKENVYYKIGGQNSLLKLFKDKRGDLQQNLKKQDIDFGKQKEKAITETAMYYDQISQ